MRFLLQKCNRIKYKVLGPHEFSYQRYHFVKQIASFARLYVTIFQMYLQESHR